MTLPSKSQHYPFPLCLKIPILPTSSMAPSSSPHSPRASASVIPFNALLSSAFHHLPFSSPRHNSTPLHLEHPSPLASAAHGLIQALRAALSEHPFLKTLISLPSDLRSFIQVGCRSGRMQSPLAQHSFAAILPGDSVAGLVVANGVNNFLNIYNTLLVVRLVLTWFPNSPPAIVSPLSTICDPYLNIFRGIIPPLGGTLDLSPILAFLVLNAITSTAAALPAELPVTAAPQQSILSSSPMLDLTGTQEKWMRRVCCKRLKDSEVAK